MVVLNTDEYMEAKNEQKNEILSYDTKTEAKGSVKIRQITLIVQIICKDG